MKMFNAGKTRMIGLPYGEKTMTKPFSSISISHVSMLTRDKNEKVALGRLRVRQNVFLVLKQLHCCPRPNVRVHSSEVELAAAGVHPVAGWHDIVTCQRLVNKAVTTI